MKLNREELKPFLDALTDTTPALFGKLKPQEMIEHVTVTFQTSTDQIQWPAPKDEEKANAAKQYMIYTDAVMPEGLKSITIGESAPPLIHKTLKDAIEKLYAEIKNFHTYYSDHPESKVIHPRMGALTYNEWVVLHGKHLTHHFKQFSLL